jgi:RsmE family RNA methyltransferase
MAIALPNKREKAELIVQKLAEIGVDEILFRSAERSVHKQWNEKKADRLYKIAKEAVEQSRGLRIPKIGWCETFRGECEGKRVVVFDKGGTLLSSSLGTSLDLH